MRYYLSLMFLVFFTSAIVGQSNQVFDLAKPDKKGGKPIMEVFSLRASGTEFDTEDINWSDLSNLLWAANGINREEKNKRTAPSAFNAQDIDIYVFNRKGIFLYLPQKHSLLLLKKADKRMLFKLSNTSVVPSTVCLLVSDISRFKIGEYSQKMNWAAIDAGMVAQNILLFCASNNMIGRPRTSMDIDAIKTFLKLKESQYPILNIFCSYKKEELIR